MHSLSLKTLCVVLFIETFIETENIFHCIQNINYLKISYLYVLVFKKGLRCLPCKDYPRYREAWVASTWAVAARAASRLHRLRGRPVNPKEAAKRHCKHRHRGRLHLPDNLLPWIPNWQCSGEKWYSSENCFHSFISSLTSHSRYFNRKIYFLMFLDVSWKW